MQDPINLNERSKVATTCVEKLNLPMPAIVDKLDDKVNQAYKGWPDRLYLVGQDGKLTYSGGRGPFFFSPDEWEQSIQAELQKKSKTLPKKDGTIENVDKLDIRRTRR